MPQTTIIIRLALFCALCVGLIAAATVSSSRTSSPSASETGSITPSRTTSPSPSESASVTPSRSDSPAASPSNSESPSVSSSRSVSPSISPSRPASVSPSSSRGASPSSSISPSTTPSPGASQSPSATNSCTPSNTPSQSVTASTSPSPSNAASVSPSPSNLPSSSLSASPSRSISPSVSPSPAPQKSFGSENDTTSAVINLDTGALSLSRNSDASKNLQFGCSALNENFANGTSSRETTLTSGFSTESQSGSTLTVKKTTGYGDVELTFNFESEDTQLTFGKSTLTLSPGSVKVLLSLSNWQALSTTSSVSLTCSVASAVDGTPFTKATLDQKKSTSTVVVQAGNDQFAAGVEIATSYKIDNVFRTSTVAASKTDYGTFTVTFASFSDNLQWDPSVTVQDSIVPIQGGGGGDGDGDGTTTGVAVGVVVGVFVLCCCAIFIVVIVVIIVVLIVKRDDLGFSRPSWSRSSSGSTTIRFDDL